MPMLDEVVRGGMRPPATEEACLPREDVAENSLQQRSGATVIDRSPGKGAAELVTWFLGRLDYERALGIQEELVDCKLRGSRIDYLLLLEHEPVFTLGRGASEADLLGADRILGIPAFRVGRGGGVTYHGPGQLVVYPVVRLPFPDVRAYIRFLASVVIAVCSSFGVEAWLDERGVGIWTERGKLASFGIGLRRWIAFHGLALNVKREAVAGFSNIVPCRTPGLPFTSLEEMTGKSPAVADAAERFCERFVWQWPKFRVERKDSGS